ncbi:MAG: cbb3-type cytochrome oxidase assembly protein CcoS [Proteobacteria bacterium]|nr:cbb3-type cytochrome oxidase assembly protein CcoS [Pseudomonadota bacterium]
MNILLALIPVSIVMLIAAGVAFFWAVDNDQFDDLDTPGLLPLLDDPPPAAPPPPPPAPPPPSIDDQS